MVLPACGVALPPNLPVSEGTSSDSLAHPLLWNDVPLDILLRIFDDLNVSAILYAQQVCKEWGQVVRQHLDISELVSREGRSRCLTHPPEALKRPSRLPRSESLSALRKARQEDVVASRRALRSRAGWLACAGRPLGGHTGSPRGSSLGQNSKPRLAWAARLTFARVNSLNVASLTATLNNLDPAKREDRAWAVEHVLGGNCPPLPETFGLGVCWVCARCHPLKSMAAKTSCRTCWQINHSTCNPVT